MARRNRYSVYDMLEEDGEFEKNPANSQARDPVTGQSTYQGPVAYPKMMYHPTGETRIIVPAEIITTPIGPKAVGEQREIIHKVVGSKEEEEELRAAGWHDRPSHAAALGRGEAPPISKDEEIARLQAELAKLQMERNSAPTKVVSKAPTPPTPIRMSSAVPPE
ncbi:MAG TPA: hypothetical protein VJQ25_10780 [Nitrospira sp.]|nr:hypothetical protein [Nitrospira sp.]